MTTEIPLLRRLEVAHRQAALASPGEAMMVGPAGRLEGLYFIKSAPDTIDLRQLYFPDAAPGELDPLFTVFGLNQSRLVAVSCIDFLRSCGHIPDDKSAEVEEPAPSDYLGLLKESFMAAAPQILTPAGQEPDNNMFVASLKNQQSLWIRVGEVDVCIKQDDEGVVVDLFARDGTSEALASTWVNQNDVAADQEAAMTPDGEE